MRKQKKNYTIIGKNKARLICLLAIVICILLYFKLNTVLFDAACDRDHFMEGYFVNTSGCHVLALNAFAKTAIEHLKPFPPMKCSKKKLLEAKTINDENYLILSMTEKKILKAFAVERISDINCNFKMVKRINDNVNKYTESGTFRLGKQRKQIKLKSGSIIIRIECFSPGNKSVYHDVHFLLPAPKANPLPKAHLSVMILGIDSISHMQYLRTMPLLRSYIEGLPHIEFWGYNRIGRNTYPNLIPLFSGRNETELEQDCYSRKYGYDKCDFIWQKFKAVGYNTCYAEDNSVIGTFNYGKRGFKAAPTDYYFRPVMLEIDSHTRYSIDKDEYVHCSASRKYADVHHEFIYKMMPHLKSGPHFSVFWETQGVHDYFQYPKFLDTNYLKLLKRLRSKHILSNTLVFLMSDHGIRFGAFRATYQGMMEESQPFLTVIYPKWFETLYPLAMANLKENAHSLVTTFDLHATLKDLTNVELLENDQIEERTLQLQELGLNMPRGISLFLPIPETRDCQLANIPAQFCLCHKLNQIATTDLRSQRAAQFIVESINYLLRNFPLCQHLELNELQDAYLLERSNDEEVFVVKVRLSTLPGGGSFEGTTTFARDSLALNGPIIRINKYGNQSYCVQHNYQIEMYCYC
ncbi:uncharacterized protein LOC132798810 [Drosophila nasuta]|uniref:uncharacterized protein LOC132798810 n=1 Tax=Drosophila nasuta TaxID=42062 RepID=UPI00295E9B80|nr:uncharacterized protein LOC132798810 [Drosophila nasuta]